MTTSSPASVSPIRRVAFIGTGVMGAAMAGHLIDEGYSLTVSNRTRAKADDLIRRGAAWADSPGTAASEADATITMVGMPSDVRGIYLGSGGIVQHARPGSLLIDMTTSEPSLAVEIAAAARSRGMDSLDAPVSGGDVGAREARLSIMAGGSKTAFERAQPLLQCMGKNIVHQGEAGAGQHTKMCNQINVAAVMLGVVESILYAQRAGLDPRVMIQSVGAGAATSFLLTHLGPRILDGDFNPGFYIRHFIKDLNIAIDEARRMGTPTPATRLALEWYQKAAEMGWGDLGTQALYKAMEADAAGAPRR